MSAGRSCGSEANVAERRPRRSRRLFCFNAKFEMKLQQELREAKTKLSSPFVVQSYSNEYSHIVPWLFGNLYCRRQQDYQVPNLKYRYL